VQNTEAWRQEHCPYCRLAQISLRKGEVEHVLHGNGSLKGPACHTHGLNKNAQLHATVNCGCICNSYNVTKNSNAKPCQNSVVWRVAKDIARQLDF
jgi:hypothetical protein